MNFLKLVCVFALICGTKKFVFTIERSEQISGLYTRYTSNEKTLALYVFCGEYNYDIERNLFNGDDILVDSMHGEFSKLEYTEFNLRNCRFHEIRMNFFKELKNVDTFNITDVYLKKLDQNTFQDASKLAKLIASSNQLTEIPAHLFSNSPLINHVDFFNNTIYHIDKLAFEGVSQLETLNLSRNQVSELKSNWLSLANLLTLDLSHNTLKHLDEHAFDEFTNLKHLNLSYNPIGNLETGIFAHLKQLETVSLKRASIVSIQVETFSNQRELISLDLSENRLKSLDFETFLPIFPNLRSFYLNQNELTDLIGFRNIIFPQLTFLDIRDNQFNCSSLRRFIEGLDWTKLLMPLSNSPSSEIHESSLRGVNCRNVSTPPTSQPNGDSDMEIVGTNNGNTTDQPSGNSTAGFKCTWHNLEDNVTFFMYRCIFVCDKQNSKVDKIATPVDSEYHSLYIDEITLENCSFDDKSTWKGVWNLKKLNASNNHLYKIPISLLSGDIKIQQLDFSKNFIEWINSATFSGIPDLWKLDLSYNKITYLHEDAFDPLINLKELDLSYNPIKDLQIETFAYLQQLEILSLKYTNLNSIQLGIFLYQHKLISLDLSENNLKSMDFERYYPIFYDLQKLDLSENKLADLNGFRNKIFPQLTLLDIRGNHFTCSYLQGFFESVDWSKLRLAGDPQLTKEHKSNVRGVDCKTIDISENMVIP